MLSREELRAKYRRAHAAVASAGLPNTDLRPGDAVRWFPFGVGSRKKALWRGTIECIYSLVSIEDGQVYYYGVKADFRAPSWREAFPVPISELERY